MPLHRVFSFWASPSDSPKYDKDDYALPHAHTHAHAHHDRHAGVDDGARFNSAQPATDEKASRDKIRCLDGLRGIACFIVYNYHFLWPWTPLIMLGYGARPPKTPEPYRDWVQLPIVCLLYRGRPMVAVFFAISGYVVCRHILKAIYQRRLDAAYRSLASAVFRRAFRLYIPATLSMFLVAVLAQLGAFKSEFAIYKGPDSVYINGTVGTYAGTVDAYKVTGVNGSQIGPEGISMYLGTMTNVGIFNRSAGFNASPAMNRQYYDIDADFSCPKCPWVRLGGMWEEHPIIHPNMGQALVNFTEVYAEWANPFTFNPYHPRYDPHTYTMPMELRGSMILYVFLLGTANLKAAWRLALASLLAVYSLRIGRWECSTFIGGMVLSELDIRQQFSDQPSKRSQRKIFRSAILGPVAFVISLYLLSYPDTNAEHTIGFRTLAAITPRYYSSSEKWRFYHSIGALMLLPCVLRSSALCRLLETRLAQYLGLISFPFYLMHGPVLHSLGFWIMPRLFERMGKGQAFAFGWVVLGVTSLFLADIWYHRVDRWSIGVSKRIQRMMEGV